MKWLAIGIAVGATSLLVGCISARPFGGYGSAAEVSAVVGKRFPVGTPLQDIRVAMEGYGYSCKPFPAQGATRGGLGCVDSRLAHDPPSPLIEHGAFWTFIFFEQDGLLKEMAILSSSSPYS